MIRVMVPGMKFQFHPILSCCDLEQFTSSSLDFLIFKMGNDSISAMGQYKY